MTRLQEAGIPVPRWQVLEPDRKPNLTGWGPYVVIKPIGGARGAGVKIKRSGRVLAEETDARAR